MIWVCRAGVYSSYLEYFFQNNKVFLPWRNSYRKDLSAFKSLEDMKSFVRNENNGASNTSIATWTSQLRIFSCDMKISDYVLIPHSHSRQITLAEIAGDYCFSENDPMKLWHSRKITILPGEILRSSLSKPLQYSLGAYRTVFRIKQEEELLEVYNKALNQMGCLASGYEPDCTIRKLPQKD